MAIKGNGKSQAQAAAHGRKLIALERLSGCIDEWHNSWGWIVPEQKIEHPHAAKNHGRVYLRTSDMQDGNEVFVGCRVNFFLYCDARGLGAGDCRRAAGAGDDEGSEAEDDEPLPNGWEKHWSAEHAKNYFWHVASKEASWDRPAAAPVGGDADDNERLPAGWEKHYDEKNQTHFYWHKATKTTSWDAPKVGVEREIGQNNSNGQSDSVVLGQKRLQGRVTKWQGSFGWITPAAEVGGSLRSLLEKHQGKIYVNLRDVQAGQILKTGSLVDFLLNADGSGVSATDVRTQGGATLARGPRTAGRADPAAVERLEQQWAAEDRKNGVRKAAEAEEDAGEPSYGLEELAGSAGADDEEMDGPLLPGWEQLWSDENKCFYYWHASSKQSSWERPTVGLCDDNDDDTIWEGEGCEEGAANLATPLTPMVAGKRSMTPITPAGATQRASAVRDNAARPTPSTVKQAPGFRKLPAPKGGSSNEPSSKFLKPSAKKRAMSSQGGAAKGTRPPWGGVTAKQQKTN